MFAVRPIIILASCLALAHGALAKAEDPPASANPSVANLIQQLDADEFSLREEASRRLLALGTEAVPELAKAAQHRNMEVSTRAFDIFKSFVVAEDAVLQAKSRQALKEIAALRDTAEKNKDDALATAAATATEILGRPFLGLFGYGMADNATVGDVVEGSPAEKAGLKAGDVVLSFGGVPTPTFQDLIAAVAKKEPGDRTKMEIDRNGEKLEVDMIVGSY
jgi:hypothetical protein